MMSSSRKRKLHHHHRNEREPGSRSELAGSVLAYLEERSSGHDTYSDEPDPSHWIQAHEAHIIRGTQAIVAARSLEIYHYDYETEDQRKPPAHKVGEALLRWGGTELGARRPDFPSDDDFVNPISVTERDEDAIWVDRYDIRLLLDALPSSTTADSASRSAPASPSGWSDLPSDTEDTFFFSPEEAEDFHREKRRKLIEKNREERLKARLAEDGEEEQVEEEEVWGGSDEEPEPTQKQLMERTAVHLLTSPNPAQLEMRILANHGKDKRFAFLRGRWSRMWRLVKGKARMEKEQKESEKKKGPGLGGLAAYGDSDDNDDSDAASSDPGIQGKEVEEEAENLEPPPPPLPLVDPRDDDAAKALRRQRAKEWADKRRAEKADKI